MNALRISLALVAVTLTASCSAITDPGRFQFEGGGGGTCPAVDPSDLGVELRNFQDFDNDMIQIMVVDTTGFLVFRGILEGIDADGIEESPIDDANLLCLRFPELIEAHGSLVVRVFVDFDENGYYDALDAGGAPFEPGWEATFEGGFAKVDGTDEPTGVDPPSFPPGNFELEMTEMAPHTPNTQHIALMVIERESGIPVGFYRIPDLDVETPTIFINEILQPDTDYYVEFYADFDRDGQFSSLDHSWVEGDYTADGEGDVVESFTHRSPFDDLDFF
jgi:hypothetical protein